MLKISEENFISRSKLVHKDKYGYNKTRYINYRTPVVITCPLHGDFSQKPKAHLSRGSGCYVCGLASAVAARGRRNTRPLKKNRITFNQFKKLANDRYQGKYTYSNYTNYTGDVDVNCPKHGITTQRPYCHLSVVSGCLKCSFNNTRMTKDQFIAKARLIHGDKYTYDKVNHVRYGCEVIITCKLHGDWVTVGSQHIKKNGCGCPACRVSRGEEKVRQFLINNKIEYTREYKLTAGTTYRYDFYLPKLNILIEYDGVQHFKPVSIFGGLANFIKIKERDREKNRLAELHGMFLIRLPYPKYADLESYLLFKISRIYKYRVGNKFYRNYLALGIGESLPKDTRPADVKQYLLVRPAGWKQCAEKALTGE